MLWITVLLETAWLLGTHGISLNPFSSFTDISLDPMTEFSVNQGVYSQNIPTSLYPFISDESFSNFVGFPGYGGFKYTSPLSTKPFNYPLSSLPTSPHLNFNGNFPPGRKPKQGRGGKPPNNHVRYNNNHNNNGNPEGNGNSERNNQPSVTLDIRGGGYKMENGKRRPYKAPSADSSDRDNIPRRSPSHGGRGNGGQRPRNKRPGNKSQRPRGPSVKSPYLNMKYEMSLPSMTQNVEFESPENVLPLLSPSMLMQIRQQKAKIGPFLYGSAGDILNPSMMQSFFQTSAFNGLKSVPGFYDSVKSAATQLLRGRKSQAFPLTLNPTTQISHLGLGIPGQATLGTTGQLASQLALLQGNAEKVFGTLPHVGNDYLGQDQALFAALTKAQGGRGVLAQIQQQQIQAIKTLQTPPIFQHQSAPLHMEPGGPLSQYLASFDPVNTGTGHETGFHLPHSVNYNSVNQGGEHNPRGVSGFSRPNPKGQTSQAVDFQQMLLQQHSPSPQQFGYTVNSGSEHASHQGQGQFFQQKEKNPLTASYGSQQEYTSATKGNVNTYQQSPYHPSDSGPNQGQSEFFNQQGFKHPKDSQMPYTEVNPSSHGHYSPDSKATYSQTNNFHNQGQGDYRIQSYNEPNDYKSSTYQASGTGQYSVYQKDKNRVTSALISGNQSPYTLYPSSNLGNSLPYTQGGDYQNQFTDHYQQSAQGQDNIPVYTPSGSSQASTYSPNYVDFYQQLSAMSTDSKFGFPVTAPTSSGKTETGESSAKKKGTVPSRTSSPLSSQSTGSKDRAAMQLPGDVSVFVSQNTQDNYMYENYPEIYKQNYYYQDGDQMSSDSDSVESENKDRSKATEEDQRYGRKKNSVNRSSDSSRTSKKSSQKPKTKSVESSNLPRSSQPIWTTAATSKSPTSSSEERKDQKTKIPSSYMIQYSPKDTADSKTSSTLSNSESQPTQPDTTAKSDTRKYHSPVPAQQPAKSSSQIASEKRQDDDYPFCARYTNTTYCLQDPEYPKEEIKDAIEKNRHPMDHFLVDISASTSAIEEPLATSLSYSFEGNVVSSSSDNNNNSSSCSSKVYYSKPLRAINTSGQWKIIVNVEFGDTGANYTQTVRLEECVNQKDGAPSACGTEPISACLQQYKLYRLLSWEKSKGFSIEAFLLPISCLCGSTVSSTPSTTAAS